MQQTQVLLPSCRPGCGTDPGPPRRMPLGVPPVGGYRRHLDHTSAGVSQRRTSKAESVYGWMDAFHLCLSECSQSTARQNTCKQRHETAPHIARRLKAAPPPPQPPQAQQVPQTDWAAVMAKVRKQASMSCVCRAYAVFCSTNGWPRCASKLRCLVFAVHMQCSV